MLNSKYDVAELCQKLKIKNNEILKTKKLNTYQFSRLVGQNEAYDSIIEHILEKTNYDD